MDSCYAESASGSGRPKKDRIRPDPDPQHCFILTPTSSPTLSEEKYEVFDAVLKDVGKIVYPAIRQKHHRTNLITLSICSPFLKVNKSVVKLKHSSITMK